MNNLNSPTVVIADDDPANRQLLATLLGYRQYRVFEAPDGVEALELISRERPQLVISDLLMPRMDGFELVQQIRADERVSTTPIIFYTASYHSDDAKRLAKACGVQSLIYKPVEPETVYAAVDAALAAPSSRRFDKTRFGALHNIVVKDKAFEQSQRLRAASDRLNDLAALGQALATELEPVQTVKVFCARAREILLAREVAVALTDVSGETMQAAARCGKDGELRMLAGTESLSADMRRIRSSESRVLAAADAVAVCRTLRLDAPPASLMAIPIATRTSHYGWIAASRLSGGDKGEFEDSMLETMAAQLAVTLERARRTAQLREQSAAREALEINYKTLFENVPDGLVQISLEGHVLLANPALAAMLGYESPADLVGIRAEDCYRHPEQRRAFLETLASRGAVDNLEVELKRRDGTFLHSLLSGRKVMPVDGSTPYFEGSLRNVTDLKTAQLALARSEGLMRVALSAARSGVAEMSHMGEHFAWGETIPAVLGLSPDELPSSLPEFLELVHPDDRERGLRDLNEILHGRSESAEFRIAGSDRTLRWIEATGRLSAAPSGEDAVLVGILTDITERKALEDQFRQAQKMEAIGQLAGGVAHDFNNLITAILGFTELIAGDLDAASPIQGDLAEIRNAGERAACLTRQLLAFSRRQTLETAIVDINELVSNFSPMLTRLLGEDVKVRLSLGAQVDPVSVDTGQIEQVLMNLTVNARDAMPRGGTVVIETAAIDLDQEYVQQHPDAQTGRHIMLAVSDTGIGMDAATQKRIFEPFFTTKPKDKGTGLGLSTVFGIVKQSSGHIYVYSEPNVGTTFKVYLPVANADVPAAGIQAPVPEAVPTGTETVLLAEDERSVRVFTKIILERNGYRVLEAEDVPSAQALASRAGHIDLLLTDMIMPGGTGADLFSRLAEDRPDLSVLYMSGYTDDTIVDRGVLKEDTAFLQKPFTSDLLVRKVHDVLDGRVQELPSA